MSSFETKFETFWAELEGGDFLLPTELKGILRSALIKNGFQTASDVDVIKKTKIVLKSKEVVAADRVKEFQGAPLAHFKMGTGKDAQLILIYKTLKGAGYWVCGHTKDHRVSLKKIGGKWTPTMIAWLFPDSVLPQLLAHFGKLTK